MLCYNIIVYYPILTTLDKKPVTSMDRHTPYFNICTVEPPNSGHIGNGTFVLCFGGCDLIVVLVKGRREGGCKGHLLSGL